MSQVFKNVKKDLKKALTKRFIFGRITLVA